MTTTGLLLDGSWTSSADSGVHTVRSPYSGDALAEIVTRQLLRHRCRTRERSGGCCPLAQHSRPPAHRDTAEGSVDCR
jgi:hypothetical protein